MSPYASKHAAWLPWCPAINCGIELMGFQNVLNSNLWGNTSVVKDHRSKIKTRLKCGMVLQSDIITDEVPVEGEATTLLLANEEIGCLLLSFHLLVN